MLVKFFDNSGNQVHLIDGDDELECLKKYLERVGIQYKKYDEEGHELDENNFPI